MFKKTISLGVLLGAIALQPVFASGFYAGAGIGASSCNDGLKINYSEEMFTQGGILGSLGLIGSIHGGYDFSFDNKLNLGLEAFFTGSTNQGNTDIYDYTEEEDVIQNFTLASRYSFGVRVLPGYKITPDVLGYVILGLARGGFRLTDNGLYGVSSSNFGAYGYQLGIGTSTNLLKNLSARLDVIYTGYANTGVNGTDPDSTPPSAPMQYNNDKLSSLSGIVSLSYKFN